MKIMYLIFSFNVGGIERLLADLMKTAAQEGHAVSLCVINKDYDEAFLASLDPRIETVLLNRAPGAGNPLVYMYRLAAEIRKRKIEILHCQGINCVLYAGLAKLLRPSLRVLNTVHDSGNYPSYSAAKIFLQNRICSMTIAISKSVEREILARRMDPKKVTTIHNAVDTRRFALPEGETAEPKDAKQSGESPVRLVCVARFFPKKKGQDVLAEAVLSLAGLQPGLSCCFAGAPAKGQEAAYEALRQRIGELGLSSLFSFPGSVDDVPALLKAMDLFVLPSRYEGFGIALIEAMSTGLPVIASDLEGPAEIFAMAKEDGIVPGALVPAGDSEALAAAIRAFVKKDAPFDRLSSKEELHAFVEKHFDSRAVTQKHLQLYERLLS